MTHATLSDVVYGDDPAQRLDVYAAKGRRKGTIVYFHSGGWVAGDRSSIAGIVGAELERGWSIVSVGYRLAPQHQALDLLADADRAIRFVRVHEVDWGIDGSVLVVAGASAGGYLATMMAAAPSRFADRALPSDLRFVDPTVDGVVSLVGPTDLHTLWHAGAVAADLETALLGCVPPGAHLGPVGDGVIPPGCSSDLLSVLSPLGWARASAAAGITLPPAYFAFGADDQLVVPETQGAPIVAAWLDAGGYARAWYDLASEAGHNLDHDINKTALDRWLDKVHQKRW